MSARPRTSEAAVARAIIGVLRRKRDHQATIRYLVEVLPSRLRLSRADRAPSPSRPNEQIWEQMIRNIKSHGSAGRLGLLIVTEDGRMTGFGLAKRPNGRRR